LSFIAALKGNSSADRTNSVVRYGVDFAISPPDVKLETSAEGVRSGSIEVAVIAYNGDGKELNAISRRIPIHLHPDVFAALQRVGFQPHEEIDLPKDEVFLQSGIYDLKAHNVGTLGIPLHVIAFLAPK